MGKMSRSVTEMKNFCAGMEPAQRFFSESKRTLYKVMVEFQSIFHNLNQPGHTEYKTVMNEV